MSLQFRKCLLWLETNQLVEKKAKEIEEKLKKDEEQEKLRLASLKKA